MNKQEWQGRLDSDYPEGVVVAIAPPDFEPDDEEVMVMRVPRILVVDDNPDQALELMAIPVNGPRVAFLRPVDIAEHGEYQEERKSQIVWDAKGTRWWMVRPSLVGVREELKRARADSLYEP